MLTAVVSLPLEYAVERRNPDLTKVFFYVPGLPHRYSGYYSHIIDSA